MTDRRRWRMVFVFHDWAGEAVIVHNGSYEFDGFISEDGVKAVDATQRAGAKQQNIVHISISFQKSWPDQDNPQPALWPMLPTYNIHTSIHGLMTLINLLSQPSTSLSPIGEYSRVALSSIAFILDNASFHQSLVQYFKPNQENHHSVTLPPPPLPPFWCLCLLFSRPLVCARKRKTHLYHELWIFKCEGNVLFGAWISF